MRLIGAELAWRVADAELPADEAGMVQFVLSHAPAIDPDSLRPKGRWILGSVDPEYFTPGGNRLWRCSECGYFASWMLDKQKANFCPNCGADMREGKDMTRKELLSVPVRKWNEILNGVYGVFVVPSRRKHDSGWACMDFVAETGNGLVRFGGGCDDVSFEGEHFRMDCDFDTKLVHIWNSRKTFTVTHDISSISFIE